MKIYIFFLCVAASFLSLGSVSASTLNSDNFDSGNLNNWTIGGRQLGTHTANVVTADTGSLAGHLYQSGSFSEINISQSFLFDSAQTYNFDLKVNVSSQSPPAWNYYGLSGVRFNFLDAAGATLGIVRYSAATTGFLASLASATHAVNIIAGNVWHNFSLSTNALLSQLVIDSTNIATTQIMFETYSSTWPYPTVTAELWVDNVGATSNAGTTSPVPLPAAAWLLAAAFLNLFVLTRKNRLISAA